MYSFSHTSTVSLLTNEMPGYWKPWLPGIHGGSVQLDGFARSMVIRSLSRSTIQPWPE